VLFNPCLDTARLMERLDNRDFARRVAGDTVEAKRASLAALSPVAHLQPGCPPAIAFYGTEDWMLDDARAFARKSAAMGNRIELWIAEGQRHGFFNASPWHEATLRKSDEFLASLGYLQDGPAIPPPDATAELRPDDI